MAMAAAGLIALPIIGVAQTYPLSCSTSGRVVGRVLGGRPAVSR
jgi:hypothetical protein